MTGRAAEDGPERAGGEAMRAFEGPSFSVALPDGARDRSTYAFVLPGKGRVRPTLVVKVDALPEGATLEGFVGDERAELAARLDGFVLHHPPRRLGGPDHVELSFEWGRSDARFVQRQRYLRRPDGGLLIATATRFVGPDHHDEHDLRALLDGLRPREAAPGAERPA